MIRQALEVLSPQGKRARLNILIFHRVLSARDDLFPEEVIADEFDSICGWIRSWFTVLRLDDAISRLASGNLPARAACITFDDGYADNHSVALPILKRHGLSATFFISTGFLNGGCMWNDIVIESIRYSRHPEVVIRSGVIPGLTRLRIDGLQEKRHAIRSVLGVVKYLPMIQRREAISAVAEACGSMPNFSLMMSTQQVLDLHRSGMEIGGHTMTHPILSQLSDSEALQEIGAGREELHGMLKVPIVSFAYPNGKPGRDYSSRDVQLVKNCGFESAVSTAWGVANHESDLMQLPRFTPWDRARLPFGFRLIRNMITPRTSLFSRPRL